MKTKTPTKPLRDSYYIHSKLQGAWARIPVTPFQSELLPGVDLGLRHIRPGYFSVMEGKTGSVICCYRGNKKTARSLADYEIGCFLRDYNFGLPEVQAQIAAKVKENGISPRYLPPSPDPFLPEDEVAF